MNTIRRTYGRTYWRFQHFVSTLQCQRQKVAWVFCVGLFLLSSSKLHKWVPTCLVHGMAWLSQQCGCGQLAILLYFYVCTQYQWMGRWFVICPPDMTAFLGIVLDRCIGRCSIGFYLSVIAHCHKSMTTHAAIIISHFIRLIHSAVHAPSVPWLCSLALSEQWLVQSSQCIDHCFSGEQSTGINFENISK